MNKKIKMQYQGREEVEVEKETPIKEVAKQFQKRYFYDILVAKVGNEIMELSEPLLKSDCIDFYDRSSKVGYDVYARSVEFMLVLAVKRIFGKDSDVLLEHSIDKGVYCEIKDVAISEEIVAMLEEEMHKIQKEDLIYTKMSVSRMDAIAYYRKRKQWDKVNVLKYISNTYINLYRLDDIYDYFYGEMAYSTKSINSFKLTYIEERGFALSYPDVENPECTLDYHHHKMLFDKIFDYTTWGRLIDIKNAADLNREVSLGKYDHLIYLAEAYYNSQLAKVAEEIYKQRDHLKLVLIAGPSSSGKTTTSKKLEIYLKSKGLNPHQISLDDYFKNRKDTPKLPSGELDLESLRAVDVDLFNKHLVKLLDGEKVLLPEYNFIKGEREYKEKWLQLKGNDIIIIEGLHCLNEELTMSIERRQKYKIYLSPLTQLNIDNHNRVHTTDTRKLRRIVRDNKHRGYNAAQTLKQWQKISSGEKQFIFPFQDDADVVVNSALIYELGILKTYVEPLLFSVAEDDEMYPEALRLINFLRNFLPIPSDEVPKDSVLREFIGGSCFFQ